MRDIRFLVVHTTASPQTTTVDAIKAYWSRVLKWRNVGYHIIVRPDGVIERLASDRQITNGVGGFNQHSLHVSYIGGIDEKGRPIDNRTAAQKQTLVDVLKHWKGLYPKAEILGHRDFPNVRKDCPCFDAKKEYSYIK